MVSVPKPGTAALDVLLLLLLPLVRLCLFLLLFSVLLNGFHPTLFGRACNFCALTTSLLMVRSKGADADARYFG